MWSCCKVDDVVGGRTLRSTKTHIDKFIVQDYHETPSKLTKQNDDTVLSNRKSTPSPSKSKKRTSSPIKTIKVVKLTESSRGDAEKKPKFSNTKIGLNNPERNRRELVSLKRTASMSGNMLTTRSASDKQSESRSKTSTKKLKNPRNIEILHDESPTKRIKIQKGFSSPLKLERIKSCPERKQTTPKRLTDIFKAKTNVKSPNASPKIVTNPIIIDPELSICAPESPDIKLFKNALLDVNAN
jgi:hypothetical protein